MRSFVPFRSGSPDDARSGTAALADAAIREVVPRRVTREGTHRSKDDTELGVIDDLRARRPEALDRLLETYGREIQAVAYLIVRDRDAAEDITMETILTGWERGRALRDATALRSWLLSIAANKSLSYRRRLKRVTTIELVPEQRRDEPDATARIALRQGVADLPPQIRAAVVLRYYADLPVAEIASALGKSPNTIKAQLQVGLDRLRQQLRDVPGERRLEAHDA